MVASGHVPSPDFATGEAALDHLLANKLSVSVAVAFVTKPGVAILAGLLERHGVVDLEVVARGAPTTDPAALLELRDHLGANVSVIGGTDALRFHPKLWLLRDANHIDVLSGSGNLTAGGLRGNLEQFELAQASGGEAEAQEQRFEALTAEAISLDRFEKSIAWREWNLVHEERARHERELERLEKRIASSPTSDGREADKQLLLDDLERIYDETVAANIPRADGQQYYPNRFKQGIDRAREGKNPVRLVLNMCRQQTNGFDVILRADMPQLTVEALVVDPDKAYHDLFRPETRRLAAERLLQFPSWPEGPR